MSDALALARTGRRIRNAMADESPIDVDAQAAAIAAVVCAARARRRPLGHHGHAPDQHLTDMLLDLVTPKDDAA